MLRLHVIYKNGNKLDQDVNYLASDGEHIIYTVRRNPHPVFQRPVMIPIKNLEQWELEEIENV